MKVATCLLALLTNCTAAKTIKHKLTLYFLTSKLLNTSLPCIFLPQDDKKGSSMPPHKAKHQRAAHSCEWVR